MNKKRYSLRTDFDEILFETNHFSKLDNFFKKLKEQPFTNFAGDRIELKLFDFGDFTGKIY